MENYKFNGNIVLWNRQSSLGYYGVIIGSELRSHGALAPWRWYNIRFTTPLPAEMKDGWYRCDHVSMIDGYKEIAKIHAAMVESALVKEAPA